MFGHLLWQYIKYLKLLMCLQSLEWLQNFALNSTLKTRSFSVHKWLFGVDKSLVLSCTISLQLRRDPFWIHDRTMLTKGKFILTQSFPVSMFIVGEFYSWTTLYNGHLTLFQIVVFIFNTARATYYLAVPSCVVRHSSATLEFVRENCCWSERREQGFKGVGNMGSTY